MVGRAAGHDEDLLDILQGFRGPVQFVEDHLVTAFVHPAPEGIPDGFGLFVDFLQHEMLEAAFSAASASQVTRKTFLSILWPSRSFTTTLSGSTTAISPSLRM